MENITTISATAVAILKAVETIHSNRGQEKKLSQTVSNFKKDGATWVVKDMPSPNKRAWSLSNEDYYAHCRAVKDVWDCCRLVNGAKSDDEENKAREWLSQAIAESLKLCDETLSTGNTVATRKFCENVRAYCRKLEVFDDGKAHETNVELNKFLKFYEMELGAALAKTTFAPDWERDYQTGVVKKDRAIRKLNKKLKTAEELYANAKTAFEAKTETIDGKPENKRTKADLKALNDLEKSMKTAELDVSRIKSDIAKTETARLEIIKTHEENLKNPPVETVVQPSFVPVSVDVPSAPHTPTVGEATPKTAENA